jgi:hypothetical protein
MGHFSMEIYAPTGSNLNGNQQPGIEMLGIPAPMPGPVLPCLNRGAKV